MAKILMQIKLPGETAVNLKKEWEALSDFDKVTLEQWYIEEQAANQKGS